MNDPSAPIDKVLNLPGNKSTSRLKFATEIWGSLGYDWPALPAREVFHASDEAVLQARAIHLDSYGTIAPEQVVDNQFVGGNIFSNQAC